MQDDNRPFDSLLSLLNPVEHATRIGVLVDVNDTIDFAKRMLVQNRVKNVDATIIVEVAKLILERIDAAEAVKESAQ